MNTPIRDAFEIILRDYLAIAELRAHPVAPVFAELERLLAATTPVLSRPALRLRWSMGRFNRPARIPWLAMLDRRETRSVRYGLYCDYLFREDMSGVYLSFSQGVAAMTDAYGTAAARELLAADCRALRDRYRHHAPMLRYEPIDLRATTSLGKSYEESSIASIFYPAGAVPEDEVLLHDLENMLSLYDCYLQDKGEWSLPSMQNPASHPL